MSITDESGNVTSFAYDSYNRIIAKQNPEGDKWQYAYDARGNLTEARHVAKVPGAPADIVFGAAYPATCTYRASCNKPTQVTDPRGGVTDYEYNDTTGQVTRVRSPAGANGVRPEVRNTYGTVNGVSMLLSTSTCQNIANCFGTADEVQKTYAYNSNLLATTETTKLGDGTVLSVVSNTYDAVGNKIAVDGPMPGASDTTVYRFDAGRQLVGEIRPAAPDANSIVRNLARRLSYTSFGEPSLVEAGSTLGQTDTAWQAFNVNSSFRTLYGTDERKSAEFQQDASAVPLTATQFNYTANGKLQCAVQRMNPAIFGSLPADACALSSQGSQGADRVTKNVYDNLGNLVQIRKALGTSVEQAYATYSYTPNGKQEYVIDANGNRTKFEYDGFDRQVKWIFPSASMASAYSPSTQANALATAGSLNTSDYEQYGYDASGNRTSLRKRDGSTLTYQYDALNRLTVKTVPDGRPNLSATHTRDVYYGYDVRGLVTNARFDSGSGEGITTAYDGLGRISSSTIAMDGFSRQLISQYDADGNRTRLTFPDGGYVSYAYDGLDRPQSVTGNAADWSRSYSYDATGALAADTVGSAGATTFGRDSIGRLSSLGRDIAGGGSLDSTTTFAYNPVSQIVQDAQSNDAYAFTARANVTRPYSPNGLNQYAAVSSVGYCYDPNGNLTADGTYVYLYDVENRLVEKRTQGSGNSNCSALSYAGSLQSSLRYDPMGRLYETIGSLTGTTRFLIDGDSLVAEYDGSGALLRRYVHGADGKADDPVAWYEGGVMTNGALHHLYANQQGSVVLTADSTGGAARLFRFDEYGIPQSGDGASLTPANGARFLYTGQAWIPDLGMYYYKARIYSPTLGRFMQTDPIGYKDQINLYAYVANDPTNDRDPTGQDTVTDEIVVVAKKVAPTVISAGSGALNVLRFLSRAPISVIQMLITGTATASDDTCAKGCTSANENANEPKRQKAKDRRAGQQQTERDRRAQQTGGEPDSGGTPGNNQAQNNQFKSVVQDLKLNEDQARQLHDAITGRNFGRQEVLDTARSMFGDTRLFEW